jgi:EmrB/QacA subfamily drug resistance transporter
MQQNRRRWFGLVFICVSLLIISLDNTVLNVALPAISRDLGASNSELQWIVDAYILVFAALLLTMGSIADRFGRKRVLQFGVGWFGLFSLMAALSTSTTMLIVTRAFLGLGGAIIMPATLSLITATFRDANERAQAIAVWAGIFGLGVGICPVLGGYLLQHYAWHSVFFVNLPVVAIALIGGYLFLDESKDENVRSPDFPGVVLSIVGLFALVYGIIQAGVDGWGASHVVMALIGAAVVLTIFFWWEGTAKNAMLPLYLFRNPSFTGANVAMTLMMFGMMGVFFAMSQYLQSVLGYSALGTGIRLLPIAAAITISAGMSARVAMRFGTKWTVGFGFLIAAVGMFILSQVSSANASYGSILFGMIIMSLGMGTAMSPATNSIMGSVPVSKAGVGSAMNDTTREIGGALGIAVLGTIVNHTYIQQVASLKPQLPPQVYVVVADSIQGAHGVAASPQLASAAQSIITVANKAFALGMADSMFIATFVMVAAAVFTFLVLPSDIRCIEEECVEEEETVEAGLPEMVPATGD